MNRRDFLERFVFALTAALFALFGIRGDVEPEKVQRLIADTARELDELSGGKTRLDMDALAAILKNRYSQKKLTALFYQDSPFFARYK